MSLDRQYLSTPIVTVPMLLMRPNKAILANGQTVTRPERDRLFGADMAERMSGLADYVTKGRVRLVVHEADPLIPYDFRAEQWGPTTEMGGAIHIGAADTYRRQFNADAYECRFFMGGPWMLNPGNGHFGLSWPGALHWIYCHLVASNDYVPGELHETPEDGDLHEVWHAFKHMIGKYLGVKIPAIDALNRYGFQWTPEYGWLPAFQATMLGLIELGIDGPGMTDDRWQALAPRVTRPTALAGKVRVIPFRKFDPRTPWMAGASGSIVRPPRV